MKRKGKHTSQFSDAKNGKIITKQCVLRSFGGQASTFLTGHLEKKDFIKIGVVLPFENF